MGFGWLFIGYFVSTLMTLNAAGSIIRVIGYGIILMSVLRLRQYHRAFYLAGVGTVMMLLVSVSLAVSDVTGFLYENLWLHTRLFSDGARTVIGYVEKGASFVFHALLLWAIRKIALETEVIKIANNAVRNFVFICLYYFVYLISFLPFAGVRSVTAELAWIAWILYIVWIAMNLLLLGSCYARICDEQDVEMERKPSRFAFVNRFREENDRRRQKAWEEAQAYRREKREKRERRRKK